MVVEKEHGRDCSNWHPSKPPDFLAHPPPKKLLNYGKPFPYPPYHIPETSKPCPPTIGIYTLLIKARKFVFKCNEK
jgi:hypothetical protein